MQKESIIFLNEKRGEKVEKSFGHVSKICGSERYFVVENMKSSTDIESDCGSFVVICDEAGTVWSTKELRIHPDHISMTDNFIMLSDHTNVYIYIFNSVGGENCNSSQSTFPKNSGGIERMFDINDKSLHPSKAQSIYEVNNEITDPVITALCVTSTMGIIAREDNEMFVYSLPSITKINQIFLDSRVPKMIEANCDFTKLGVIDSENTFQIYNLGQKPTSELGIKSHPLVSSSVDHTWAMKWSADDPNSCVIMNEDNVLEIQVEGERIDKFELLLRTNGYLMDYSNLEITLVFLNDIILRPHMMSDYCTLSLPSKTLENANQTVRKFFQPFNDDHIRNCGGY